MRKNEFIDKTMINQHTLAKKESFRRTHPLYEKIVGVKMVVLRPLLFLLTKLKITSNHLTLLSLLIFLPSLYFIEKNPWIVIILYFVSFYFLDTIDGALARYQKTASDRGKFIDVFRDILIFIIFGLSLVKAGYINAFLGSAYIILEIVFEVISIIRKAAHVKSDWFFFASSNMLSNFFLVILPIVFLVQLLVKFQFINIFLMVSSIILAAGIPVVFLRVISIKK